MDIEKIVAVGIFAVVGLILGSLVMESFAGPERRLRCQVEHKARPTAEIAVLCGVLK
jgi:hypothetical protein